jgi:hypothetical protein
MWIVDLIAEMLEEEDNEICVFFTEFYWDNIQSIEEALRLACNLTGDNFALFEPSIVDCGNGDFQITLRG